MANSVSHASLPYPIKGARFTLLVPFLDADGDPTDPTTPDTEVSQDGGAYADAAEEVTTITGSNGSGYITLTGAEMNNSVVGVAFKVASGPKATLAALYPRNLPILESGTAGAGAAGSITLAAGTYTSLNLTGCFIRTTGGTGGGGTGGANNQARRITAYNTSTRVATVTPNWETTPDATTTYDILLPEGVLVPMLTALPPTTLGRTLTIESDGMAHADVKEWLAAAVTLSTGNKPDVNVDEISDDATAPDTLELFVEALDQATGQIDSGTFQTGAITAAAIAQDAIGADELGADAIAEIADQVWDENLSQHQTAGSTGEALDAAGSAGDPWITSLPGSYTAGQAGKILGDYLDAAVSSRASQTSVTTIDDFLDTEIAAILAAVDTEITSIQSSISGLNDLSSSEVADAVWDALEDDHRVSGSFGEAVTSIDENVVALGSLIAVSAIVTGTPTSSAFDTGLTGDVDGFYDDCVMTFTSGALAGQSRVIASHVQSNGRLTFDEAWTSAPSAGDVFDVFAGHTHPASEIADAVWDESLSGHSTAGTGGKLVTDANTAVTSGTYGNAALKTLIDAIDDYVDSEVAAIKAKTDQLTFTSANKVDATLQAAADIANAVAQKVAHIVLRRTMTNVEASSDGDTLDLSSLYGLIQMLTEASASGTTLTVRKTDATTLGTKTLTTNASADPITGIT